jgi:Thrombospondin type 3 repeat
MLIGLLLAVLMPATAQAATLAADYNFNGNLDSSVPGPPPLDPIGSLSYATENVGNIGYDRVLTFASGGGVHLNTTGLADPHAYTIVFRFRLHDLGTATASSIVSKRLLSWFPTTGSDAESGLYTYGFPGAAKVQEEIYSAHDDASQTGFANELGPNDAWHEIAFVHVPTNTGDHFVTYVDASSDLAATSDQHPFGIETQLTSDGVRFFKDDCGGGECEETSGAVSRIRLYNGQLSVQEIGDIYHGGDAAGPAATDIDGDGVANASDNCPNVPNADQTDSNGDGKGDACDPTADTDGDGVPSVSDNCPLVPNPDQADSNHNGTGDACEPNPDIDGDGLPNSSDNCPQNANPDQADLDRDGIGDVCDPDVDGDGVPNTTDLCPLISFASATGCPPAITTLSGTPKLTGSGSHLILKTGIVATCPTGSATCPVTITLTANPSRVRAARRVTLGKLKTTLQPGEKKKLSLKLSKTGVRLLRKAKRLKAKLVVVVVGPDKRPATTTRTVKLKAPH